MAAPKRVLQQAVHAIELNLRFGLGAMAQAQLLQPQHIDAQLRG